MSFFRKDDDLTPALESSLLLAEARKLWRLIKPGVTRYYRLGREGEPRVVHVYEEHGPVPTPWPPEAA